MSWARDVARLRRAMLMRSRVANIRATLVVRGTQQEIDWVKHAASLRHLSVSEYVKRAVNAQLRKEGVDAVLFELLDE